MCHSSWVKESFGALTVPFISNKRALWFMSSSELQVGAIPLSRSSMYVHMGCHRRFKQCNKVHMVTVA